MPLCPNCGTEMDPDAFHMPTMLSGKPVSLCVVGLRDDRIDEILAAAFTEINEDNSDA